MNHGECYLQCVVAFFETLALKYSSLIARKALPMRKLFSAVTPGKFIFTLFTVNSKLFSYTQKNICIASAAIT